MDINQEFHEVTSLDLPKFEFNLAKINKKAKKLGFPQVGYKEVSRKHVPAKSYFQVMGTDEYAHPAFDIITVELFGETPFIQGWNLIGVLEHTPDFDLPIVHSVPGCKVPQVFWQDKSRTCDHCSAQRNRKDTFVIQNVDTKEYKQIGRKCIADFLPGMSPSDALAYSKFYCNLGSAVLDDCNIDIDFSNQIKWDHAQFDAAEVLAITSAVIRKDGWISKSSVMIDSAVGSSTSSSVMLLIQPPKFYTEQHKEDFKKWAMDRVPGDKDFLEAKTILEWLKSEEFVANSEYSHNLKQLAVNGGTNYRNIGTLVSAVACYNNYISKRAERKETLNEWVGKEKDRLRDMILEVVNTRYLEGQFGTTTMIQFNDSEGRRLVWFASGSMEVWKGDKYVVTGTVKKLDTFKGTKQTILTRCVMDKLELQEAA